MKTKTKEHLANFFIAGFTYYDGVEVFQDLKIGTPLTIKLDSENKYDARAVMICYKDCKLGYIPRSENRIFYKLLTIGLENNITLRIQQLCADNDPEEQIRVVAHLLKK